MAMNIVDEYIIDTIVKLDSSVFDDLPAIPETVNELSNQILYRAIVVLLWTCDPKTKTVVSSKLLPQSMTSRFRSASDIVDAVKTLGVRDQIDYHTLLYGRSKELRNILIGLIEKLPKETSVIIDSDDPFKKLIFTACDYDATHSVNFQSKQRDTFNRHAFVGFNGDIIASLRSGDRLHACYWFLCAILESNFYWNGKPVSYKPIPPSRGIKNTSMPCKLPLMAKPKLAPKPSKNVLSQKQCAQENEKEKRLSNVSNLISSTKRLTDEKRAKIDELQKAEMEECTMLDQLKMREKQVDFRLLKLLQSPEALSKLQNFIDVSGERMNRLQSRWLLVQSEKVNAIKAASQSQDLSSYCSEQEIDEIKYQINGMEDQIQEMRATLQKLQNRSELREDKQINRSLYTKQIFDIVSSILKQQEEIDKIATENKQLQKDIKSLVGKLGRTFTVVENRLHNDLLKDTKMQKAYRILIKIYEECSWVLSAIDSCGQLESENEGILDQIAVLRQKKTDEKFESIVNDWMEVKKEYAHLLLTSQKK